MLRRQVSVDENAQPRPLTPSPRATLAQGLTNAYPRAKPPREPPFKLAFFIKPSYWCDVI